MLEMTKALSQPVATEVMTEAGQDDDRNELVDDNESVSKLAGDDSANGTAHSD